VVVAGFSWEAFSVASAVDSSTIGNPSVHRLRNWLSKPPSIDFRS
jgi:hypothetical protein